jgi:hypothetical protein
MTISELGINPKKLIHIQKPNPLSDHKPLDDPVFFAYLFQHWYVSGGENNEKWR